jgi:hypothetical protein
MSDTNQDQDKQTEDLAALRKAASEGSKARAEAEAMKREMAFMRAGIDTTSKPAQALVSNYDGELTPEAIQAEAAEWGLVKTPAPTPSEPEQSNTPSFSEESAEVQQQRIREKASGAPAPNEPPQLNGVEQAFVQFEADRTSGISQVEATNRAFGKVIQAAAAGDSVARFNEAEWEKTRDRYGHGAEHAR